MGWGPLAWERRPRPAAQTPWHARRSCQDAGVGWPARPWPWLSPCAAARDLVFLHKCNYLFPASALAPGAPRVQPQGLLNGLCSTPRHAPAWRLTPPGTRVRTDPNGPAMAPRPQLGSPSSGASPAERVYRLLGPSSPSSAAPQSPPRLRWCQSWARSGPPRGPNLLPPLPCGGSRGGIRPRSHLDSAPCRQLTATPPASRR